jgi:hypothetical protein
VKPAHLKKALGDITALTDGGLDARLDEVMAKKAPPEAEEPSSVSEMGDEPGELTPDEVEKLRALLAQNGG